MRAITFLFISFIVFGAACNNSSKNEERKELQDDTSFVSATQYKIPSPIEMFSFLKSNKIPYSSEVLNPIGNWQNYTDSKSQAINLGIYTTDLAYSAANEQYQEAILYFDLVRKLGDKVGVSAVFNQPLLHRIENNLNHADSLLAISSQSYYEIINFLNDNQRGPQVALIAAAGWLEAIYIVTQKIETIDNDENTLQRVADQRFAVENLVPMLEQNKSNADVASTIEDFKPIVDFYMNLQPVKVQETTLNNSEETLTVSGGVIYSISNEQIKELSKLVSVVRSKYVGKPIKKNLN